MSVNIHMKSWATVFGAYLFTVVITAVQLFPLLVWESKDRSEPTKQMETEHELL